ncbi:hypothetical protein QWA68_016167 [Fusarium oxysporum]|nr:hypothetical protein QWA68_016167 [Fusarium oxysporum]
MATFTKHAIALPDLMAQMPLVNKGRRIKNQEACLHRPASIVRPTQVQHIQQCVKWALEQNVGLTVIGGSHSGQCLWPNVVSIDMSAFDQVHMVTAEREGGESNFDSTYLIVVEAGSNTGDIIRKTMAVGVTVPLGARPSVGSGLWLQGGIGHLARLHGLACDAVVASYSWCLDYKQMGRCCTASTGLRQWTKEEMMAYLDWDKAEADRIEAQVAEETENERLFTSRSGLGELWEMAQRDIDEQEALYSAAEQEESCIVVQP